MADIHELGVRYRADGQEQVKQANRDVATTGREAEQATTALSVAQTKRTVTDRGAAQGTQEVTRATKEAATAIIGTTRATQGLEQETIGATRATNAAAAANRNMATSTVGATRAIQGFDLRGVSMQLSQVAQQSMATGDVVRALAIQLPDIGLAFGTVGIAAGVAAGVLLPLAANFFNMGDAADEATDATDAFIGALDSYSAYADTATTHTVDLREEFGKYAEDVRRHAQFMAQIEAGQAIGALASTDLMGGIGGAAAAIDQLIEYESYVERMRDMSEQGVATYDQLFSATQNLEVFRDTAEDAARSIGLTADQVRELAPMIGALNKAETMDGVATAAGEVLSYMQEIYAGAVSIPEPVADFMRNMKSVQDASAQAATTMGRVAGEMGTATAGAENFAAAIGAVNLSGLADGAAFLAQMMGAAADEAIRYNSALNQQAGIAETRTGLGFSGLSGSADDGRGLGVGQTRVGFGNLDNTPLRSVTPLPKATRAGRGGGAGSAAKDAAKELEKTTRAYESLMASLDPLIAAEQDFAAAQETINDALKAGKITAEEAAVALALVSEEYKETLSDIADDETEERIGKIRDGMESLTETLLRTAMAGDSVGEALRNFLMDALIQSAAQNLANSLSGMFGGGGAGGGFLNFLFGGKNADGNAFSGGDVIAFADGGVVGSDTYFPMSGGRTGLMGEAGPEAIMPLSRGSDGKLGVKTQGGGSQSVRMPIHVDARGANVGVAEQIVQALQAALPQFTASAVNAVYSKNRENPLR